MRGWGAGFCIIRCFGTIELISFSSGEQTSQADLAGVMGVWGRFKNGTNYEAFLSDHFFRALDGLRQRDRVVGLSKVSDELKHGGNSEHI